MNNRGSAAPASSEACSTEAAAGTPAISRAHAEARMIRDRDMMLATLLGREAHVAAGFARHRVSEAMECAREVTPR